MIFDLGGLMFSLPFGIAAGNMWDVWTIIITAVIGVITTVLFAVKLFFGAENITLFAEKGQD